MTQLQGAIPRLYLLSTEGNKDLDEGTCTRPPSQGPLRVERALTVADDRDGFLGCAELLDVVGDVLGRVLDVAEG